LRPVRRFALKKAKQWGVIKVNTAAREKGVVIVTGASRGICAAIA